MIQDHNITQYLPNTTITWIYDNQNFYENISYWIRRGGEKLSV